MSIIDLVIISIEILEINIGSSLDKKFIELIYMSQRIVLYLPVNQVDLCHSCVYDPLT